MPEITDKFRTFQQNPNISLEYLARGIEAFLSSQQGMISQIFRTDSGFAIQTKKKEEWKKYLLLDNAVQIDLSEASNAVQAHVGGGKWVSKAATLGAGLVFAAPAAIALAGFGAYSLYSLPDKIFEFIESFLASNGRNIYVPPDQGDIPYAGPWQANQAGSNNYGNNYNNDRNYNSDRSYRPQNSEQYQSPFTNQEPSNETACPSCGKKLSGDSNFCPNCGTKLGS